jgi:Crp-like helix-turn-helix domain
VKKYVRLNFKIKFILMLENYKLEGCTPYGKIEYIPKGDILYGFDTNNICLVRSGVVETIERSGIEKKESDQYSDPIIDFAGRGQTIKLALENQIIRAVNNPAEVQIISSKIIQRYSDLDEQIQFDIENSRARALQLNRMNRFIGAKDRIHFLLTHLTCNYKEIWKNIYSLTEKPVLDCFIELPIRISHQRIAHTVGATRVTVTKSLKELNDEGKICCIDRSSINGSIFAVRKSEIE